MCNYSMFACRINQSFEIAQPIVPSGFNQLHPVKPMVMALANQADLCNALQPVLM